jgi:hypothetical protein
VTVEWVRAGDVHDALDRLTSALWYPFGGERRAAFTVAAAAFTYVALVLSTFPGMSVQMLGAGLTWFDETVVLLTQNTVATVGYAGLTLIVVYAMLTGIAVTDTVASVRAGGVSNVGDATGILPGLLASGCASCGAGVLGLVGFAGALAAMPFHGNLLRVGGIVLLLGVLTRTGDPTACRID